MRKKMNGLRGVVLPAALALLVALGPVSGVTAYAAENSDAESDVIAEQAAGHKYVISNKSDDPMYWHDDDCRQDVNGVSVAPGDPGWPDELLDTSLDGELLGHSDARCYKVYIDDPTLLSGVSDGETDEETAGDVQEDPAEDGFEHGPDCVQIHHLVCDDTDPDHVHDNSCYESGNVDEHGWDHDDSCVHGPSKPALINLGAANSTVNANTLASNTLDTSSAADDGIAAVFDGDMNYEDLPSTGGAGTGVLVMAGMAGVLACTAGVFCSRKRKYD